ncbi:hypothetical protein Tco_0458779 [Tanacetum coccineum]
MIVDAIQQERENFRSNISSQVNDAITNHIPSQVDSSVRSYMSGHVFHVHPIQATPTNAQEQQHQLYLTMNDNPQPSSVCPRDQDDPHDDAHPEGENSAKRQKTSEHGTFVFGESLFGQDYESKPDDDVLSNEKVSQELMDEMSQTVDEAKLRKVVDEMLRQQYYKNLNKNDIEDMYLLIINHKVDDYAETRLLWSLSVFIRSTMIWEKVHDFQLGVESYQQQVNLIAPTITLPGIEKYKVFSIISELVYGIIYKNSKKEKRVMRHQKVHKFCDATLKRVLEGLKSYNNDVKYGYVTHNLSKEDVEYLQLFAEEIKERFKYHDQMRRWEMYTTRIKEGTPRIIDPWGRLLGS